MRCGAEGCRVEPAAVRRAVATRREDQQVALQVQIARRCRPAVEQSAQAMDGGAQIAGAGRGRALGPERLAGFLTVQALGFRWGVLRWCILAEESSDKTVTSARLTPQFGVKIVARPYSRWVAECLPKAFHPSQQDPTEPMNMHEQHVHSSVERGGTLTQRTQDGAVSDARTSSFMTANPFAFC